MAQYILYVIALRTFLVGQNNVFIYFRKEFFMSIKKGVAIVGYGGIGTWHIRHILNSDVVELKGVWDIDEKKRA